MNYWYFTRTLADRHVSDDPFYRILPFVAILAVQVGPKLKVLAWSMVKSTDVEDTIGANQPFFGAALENTFIAVRGE